MIDKTTEEKYEELIMAVEKKHPSETRHETALRYIKWCEEPKGIAAKDASAKDE